MRHTKTSKDCFDENLRLFSNPQTQPEKYNLYQGLASLAEAVSDLQADVNRLKQAVNHLTHNR